MFQLLEKVQDQLSVAIIPLLPWPPSPAEVPHVSREGLDWFRSSVVGCRGENGPSLTAFHNYGPFRLVIPKVGTVGWIHFSHGLVLQSTAP